MKKIKDPELFQKIRTFLTAYLPVIRAKSGNTIGAYRIAINLYLTYIQQSKNVALSEIRKEDFNQANIISFLNWLERERANSINTRNQRMVNIRQFCKYLMFLDMLSYAEYAMIQQIAKKTNPKTDELVYLSIEEMKLVLKQPDTKKKTGIRDRFYLALLYDSGCRNQELLDLKLKDFVIRGNAAEVHILGKGKKYRVTPISKDVADLFVRYCDTFHPHKQLDEYIFYTKRNGITMQMSADNVARFMLKYENQIRSIKSDITHLHPHLLRHYGERYKMVSDDSKPAKPACSSSIHSPFYHCLPSEIRKSIRFLSSDQSGNSLVGRMSTYAASSAFLRVSVSALA